MKKIRKVPIIEVKRTFVIPLLIQKTKGKKKFLGLITKSDFDKKLATAKKKSLAYSEMKLDTFIADSYSRETRLKAYNNADWYLGEVTPDEIGVWRGAGGLPRGWTQGSLKQTAQKVKAALAKNPKLLKKRARHAIPNMLETNVADLQKQKYLYPIIFEGGTGTKGRKWLKKKMKGDIDDGCMRSIAITIAGAKKIKAYVGFPKK